jgi:hypothetical protein
VSDYYITKNEIKSLFVDGPFNSWLAKLAAIVPFTLILTGLFAGMFLDVKFTDNQVLYGFGGLFLATICLPSIFQKK